MMPDRCDNLYLHFLDRELRFSVHCDASERSLLIAILAATSLARGRLFCSYSHLWESATVLGASVRVVEPLVRSGLVVPASEYVTSEEFLKSRRIIYAHDSPRYPFYFRDQDHVLSSIQPAYRTSQSATSFLEGFLSRPLTKSILATAADRSDAIRRALDRGLDNRGDRAITGALFTSLKSQNPDVMPAIRRAISFGYLSHYMNQCSADILTGFEGLSLYDSLAREFPIYDLRLFVTVLSLAGFDLRLCQTPHALVEMALSQRDTASHTLFLETWLNVIGACMADSSHGADPEPSRGYIFAELRRRAARTRGRQIDTLRFDYLAEFLHALGTRKVRPRKSTLSTIVSRVEPHSPRSHVVILIHGIRTQAEWQQAAAAALESEPSIRVRPTRYGYFDVVRFLLPFKNFRYPPVRRIITLIRDELSKKPQYLSVVAHSFGTYIIGRILQEEPDLEFHRLLLCGSIIPDDFPWQNYRHRLAPGETLDWQVVNEIGMNDPWPILAQSVTWGYGSSGRLGFGHVRVKDRFHREGHSGFFSGKFVRTYWLPYLMFGQVVEGELNRPPTPWLLSFLTLVPLRWFIICLILALSSYVIWSVMS